MDKLTNTLRNPADERLFESLRAASRRYPTARAVWSYKLIGSALRCSASTAARAHAAYITRKFHR